MGAHLAGEDFTLIEPSALAGLEAPAGSIGASAKISATGVGDAIPATASRFFAGRSLLPPSPVHLVARRLSDGDVTIRWTRRSRRGWIWIGGADTPLGEERERYRLIIAGEGFQRVVETEAPAFLYTATMQSEDGAVGALFLSVQQAGDHGLSQPSILTLE